MPALYPQQVPSPPPTLYHTIPIHNSTPNHTSFLFSNHTHLTHPHHPAQTFQTTPPPDLLEATKKIQLLYGDWLHQETGTSLLGGIANDPVFQEFLKSLVSLPMRFYYLPNESIYKLFFHHLSLVECRVVIQLCNFGQFLMFSIVFL